MVSCKKKRQNGLNPCFTPYTITQLFKDYDSTAFKIYRSSDTIEVLDYVNADYHKGFYIFKNRNLVSYSFSIDSIFDYNFNINYDSLGDEIKKGRVGEEVACWLVNKPFGDSIRISIFLYGINRAYSSIRISGFNFSEALPSGWSKIFSNLAIVTFVINKHQKENLKLTGTVWSNCTNEKKYFTDSLATSEIY